MRSLVLASLVLSGLTLLPACSHPKPEASPDTKPDASPDTKPEADPAPAPAEEPEPAPEAAPADAVVEEMRLVPSELRVSEDGTKLEHCLDCKRKSATYTYCNFDKDAFFAALGTAPTDEAVTLRVKMVPTTTTTSVPDDPRASQPAGGFRHKHHDCTVEAVVPPS